GAIAYGSIARGDISETSDIDIFIPNPPSPPLIETALERAGFSFLKREIIQATPSYAAKGYIEVGEERSFSFPLVRLRPVEIEFYRFAGAVDLDQLERGVRVPGVDKRLMLIEPTPWGHVEGPVEGREGVVASLLEVGVRVVLDRVRTLRRRARVGRTGVFLKRVLAPDEGFGEVFQKLSSQKPAIRRRLRA
ncbi:MAG: nucleotidyltransferase domain-containing protein, partial [Candidatus Bathyarchaeia archaeon]